MRVVGRVFSWILAERAWSFALLEKFKSVAKTIAPKIAAAVVIIDCGKSMTG